MASLKQWDRTWFNRFKKIYAANISMLALYPSDALGWMRIMDVAYGKKQAERAIRNPDQDVQVAKNEEYTKPKYAASEIITLDMPAFMDELRVREEYYAGDVANALGHVADINANYKRAIMKAAWLGLTTNPYMYGIEQTTVSGSTTIETPGNADTAAVLSTVGAWSTFQNMSVDIANCIARLEEKGFYGPKALLAPPLLRPFLSRYRIEYSDTHYTFGVPVYYNPYIDTGATNAAAAIYIVDTDAFELHMTPFKARAYWNDEVESYVWRWKVRMVPMAIPKNDGTDYLKGIIGFDIDVI